MIDEPVITFDGLEHGVWYPEDQAYKMMAALPPDENGIRHADPTVTAAVRGWWTAQAIKKADAEVASLEIPWEELKVTEEEVAADNLISLAQKLARISYYIVRSNDVWGQATARYKLCKESLDHAVNRNLARPAPEGQGRLNIAARTALEISKTAPLRKTKIEVLEAENLMNRMAAIRESLDVLWRTCSRILSVRLREPLDDDRR